MDLYREKLATRRIATSTEIASDLPRVRIGDDDLKTVLSNLVGNAIKYGRDDGSLRLRAALREDVERASFKAALAAMPDVGADEDFEIILG